MRRRAGRCRRAAKKWQAGRFLLVSEGDPLAAREEQVRAGQGGEERGQQFARKSSSFLGQGDLASARSACVTS